MAEIDSTEVVSLAPDQVPAAVVVGVDGSEASDAAVDWAVAEAARHRWPVVLVRVVETSWPVSGYPVMVTTDFGFDNEVLRHAAGESLAASARRARAAGPGVDVHTVLDDGPPALRLSAWATANSAHMLVVGSSRHGAVVSAVLGSTTSGVLGAARTPVVVVRGPAEATGGHVVVGVDGSPESRRALEFGFRHAAEHGARLVAVHAWSDRPLDHLVVSLFSGMGDDRPSEAARRMIDDRVGAVAPLYPDVPVEVVHEVDRPADALVEAATGALLLVVGGHGRGAATRLVLGSVSQAVAHRAPCPVAIVTGHEEPEEEDRG
ncbi:nucleotide-binding universal stress UspA family protein [Actinokineospora baliensis]|uniref:universal stress protein n=1 Tax=Actinokineospora baliensis TaxID=547056 RepID=UPI001956CE60|nr:universal stress protein [Actinokineospora baliensis]MBM7774052.1 nucleotide-binding universal stress UspA family protein [Actinokineospora baliensis]